MKKIFLGLLLLSSLLTIGQRKFISNSNITTKGYLVSYNKAWTVCLVKSLIKVDYFENYSEPVKRYFHWKGGSKDSCIYYYSEPDSTAYGPCGYMGMYEEMYTKYQGDSLADYSETLYADTLIKTIYFIPDSKKKNGRGKQYQLKEGEMFGLKDKWYWKNQNVIYTCS